MLKLRLPLGLFFSGLACSVGLVAVVAEQESSLVSMGWLVHLDQSPELKP